jgi:hypothetical protein
MKEELHVGAQAILSQPPCKYCEDMPRAFSYFVSLLYNVLGFKRTSYVGATICKVTEIQNGSNHIWLMSINDAYVRFCQRVSVSFISTCPETFVFGGHIYRRYTFVS